MEELVNGDVEPPAHGETHGDQRQPAHASVQAAIEPADGVAKGESEDPPEPLEPLEHGGDSTRNPGGVAPLPG